MLKWVIGCHSPWSWEIWENIPSCTCSLVSICLSLMNVETVETTQLSHKWQVDRSVWGKFTQNRVTSCWAASLRTGRAWAFAHQSVPPFAPQHPAGCPAHNRYRTNKPLVWITAQSVDWNIFFQARTLHPVRSILRSRPTLSDLLFEKFKDDPSVRVKLQQLPQFRNIVSPQIFMPTKAPQPFSQLWPLQLLSPVSGQL